MITLRLTARRRDLLRAIDAGQVARHYGRAGLTSDDYQDWPDDPGLCASSQFAYRPLGLRKVTAQIVVLLDAELIEFAAAKMTDHLTLTWRLTAAGRTAIERSTPC